MRRIAPAGYTEARCQGRDCSGQLLFYFRRSTPDSEVVIQIKCRRCGLIQPIKISPATEARAPAECHTAEVLNGALCGTARTHQG